LGGEIGGRGARTNATADGRQMAVQEEEYDEGEIKASKWVNEKKGICYGWSGSVTARNG
jgi:hypothetical protein